MQEILDKNPAESIEWSSNPPGGTKQIGENESYRRILLFGGADCGATAMCPHEFQYDLNAPGAALELLIIYLGCKNSSLDLQLKINHLAPSTSSRVYLRSVLGPASRLNFPAQIWIPAKAVKSDSYLRCDSLLLGSGTIMHTIPALEIEPNDVRAGHAASCSRPDEEQLFYLQSRGFALSEAVRIVAEGFLASGFQVFKTDSSQARAVRNGLPQWLENLINPLFCDIIN